MTGMANLKSLNFIKKIIKKETLQVNGKIYQVILSLLSKSFAGLKKVSLRLSVNVKASVSIEASIAIPIFLFCFLEIMSLLNYLWVYSGVLYAVKAVGEPVSILGNVYDEVMDSGEEFHLGKEVISALAFSEIYLASQVRGQCDAPPFAQTIRDGAEGISFLGSHINTREDSLLILARYTMEPLFSFAGTSVSMSNRYYGRLWTGYSLGENEEEAEYVYITENGSVYHLTKSCTHLKLSIKSVDAKDLWDKRNNSGGRYTACNKCCEEEEEVSTYYITATGDRYHMELSCSGLKRTIYMVTPEEVADWSLCGRCGQEEGADEK